MKKKYEGSKFLNSITIVTVMTQPFINIIPLNVGVQWLTTLLRIREVPGLNIGLETG
jgi:hypothetical protein